MIRASIFLGLSLVSLTAIADSCPAPQIFSTQFTATQEVAVTQAKIVLVANSTVAPASLGNLMTTLSSFKDHQGHALTLKSIDQNKTDSGMINVRAVLEDIVPIGQTAMGYQFVADHSGAGTAFVVDSISPYWSIEAQEQAKHTLELALYQQALKFAQTLSKEAHQSFEVSSFNTNGSFMPMMSDNRMMVSMAMPQNAGNTSSLAVSQSLTLTAQVTYRHSN